MLHSSRAASTTTFDSPSGIVSGPYSCCSTRAGKQPAPRPGIHNSGWVRAPGTARLFDSRTWGGLESYTRDIVKTFGSDSRVLMWDLFNEPSNSGYLDAVVPLLKSVFAW